MKIIDTSLYLVTDNPSRYTGNWLDSVVAAVEGGVTCVQYRDTESDDATAYARLCALKDALRPTSTPLIVNNSPQLAAAVQAQGVHVGQGDCPFRQVRGIVGEMCEVGLSITSLAEARAFMTAPDCDEFVDILGIGPVFDARRTKADAAPAMGPVGLAQIIEALDDFPNVAIGGITLDNAAAVLDVGAQGLAVVSAFSHAPDPAAVARTFREILQKPHPPV